jgi:nitrate reductase NapE
MARARPATLAIPHEDAPATRGEELRVFLFLTVVLAPVLAVMIVGGYGFLVWMYQVVTGPPGAPPL